MREIGRHDDQRLLATPEPLEDLRDLLGSGLADHERHELEAFERDLEKRQLHFERVLARVRKVGDHDLRQRRQKRRRVRHHRHVAQWRREEPRRRQRETGERHEVRRPEEDDAGDSAAPRLELAKGAARHGTGIDVAGVRRDERLRAPAERRIGRGEMATDLGFEPAWIGRIEAAGHGRRSDLHGFRILLPPPRREPRGGYRHDDQGSTAGASSAAPKVTARPAGRSSSGTGSPARR